MSVVRYFMGWDGSLTEKAASFLIPSEIRRAADFHESLIVVPTRQAGRRLREALARRCLSSQAALLSLRVVTPAFFLKPDSPRANEATETISISTWADVLLGIDTGMYPGIFPYPISDRDNAWAIATGEMIQGVREDLTDGGFLIADVLSTLGPDLDELDRWTDLANLERLYMDRLFMTGFEDPCSAMIKRAADPQIPEDVKRIVVAGLPSPSPLALRALETLSQTLTIDILVHAPDRISDTFDGWGRPIPEAWRNITMDIPSFFENVGVVESTAALGAEVVDVISACGESLGPHDIAIGVPDSDAIPFIESALDDVGLDSFNPADRPLAKHPIFTLLAAFHSVVKEGSYSALSGLLRHSDMLRYFAAKDNKHMSSINILSELDLFQNKHLPVTIDAMAKILMNGSREKNAFPSLTGAIRSVRRLVADFSGARPEDGIRNLLKDIYHHRTVARGTIDDEEFKRAAQDVDEALRDLSNPVFVEHAGGNVYALDILMSALQDRSYHRERTPAPLEIEGWIELAWNDAQLLIVAGMNEGFVPGGSVSDPFLPDSLRTRLGIKSDAEVFARDAFLMKGMTESRRDGHRVRFLVPRFSTCGEPLKPSRLLFLCPEKELPDRVRLLFGPVKESKPLSSSSLTFPLKPPPPSDFGAGAFERIHVTSFRDYLACPLRFYFKHVLQMRELNDGKREMDALDFGLMVHAALQDMAEDKTMKSCNDEHALADYLSGRAESWIMDRYGKNHSLSITIALYAAKQRLRAAARCHVELLMDGWRILQAERAFRKTYRGVTITGKIDRVDINDSGTVRIIDYKTSDGADPPSMAHLRSFRADTPEFAKVEINGREFRWTDLQLPLYRSMIREHVQHEGPIQLAYFNLPKAVNNTGISPWEDFSDPLEESAVQCSEAVIRMIGDGNFWPPADRVDHDDFESILFGNPAEAVDGSCFDEQ